MCLPELNGDGLSDLQALFTDAEIKNADFILDLFNVPAPEDPVFSYPSGM